MERNIVIDYENRKKLGYTDKTLTHFVDATGNRMFYIHHNGYNYPTNIPLPVDVRLQQIKDFKCRDDDIILVSYPKSGMHWMVNLVNMLVKGQINYSGTPLFIDFDDLQKISNLKEPRIIASHLRPEKLPDLINEGHGRVINISRNPKDCVVSHFTFYKHFPLACYVGSFDAFLRYFYVGNINYGSWFDHVKTWSTSKMDFPKISVLHLRYEDLKENLYDEIVKIVRFLGLEYDEGFLRQVEERCTFRSMQHGVKTEVGPDDRWTKYITLEGGHLPIYRKGEVGEWKNWLTLAQNEEFDAVIERELQNTGLAYRYESKR